VEQKGGPIPKHRKGEERLECCEEEERERATEKGVGT
jgi:hypothetical protein